MPWEDVDRSVFRSPHRKDPKHMRDYFRLCRLLPRTPEMVVEVGVDRGGSVLFWYDLWRPRKVIGFDNATARVVPHPLIYVEGRAGGDPNRPICVYPADQRKASLVDVWKRVGGSTPIDFFVDDGSHIGKDSEALLRLMWPFIRPGGIYVVEDWEAGPTMFDFILSQLKRAWQDMDMETPMIGPLGARDLDWVYCGQSLVALGRAF